MSRVPIPSRLKAGGRLKAAGIALAATLSLSACTDGYGGYGISAGAGYYGGGYYGDPYYDGYGYGYGYPGYGWYGGWYYPGSGYYVYDRGGQRRRWNDGERGYWQNRGPRNGTSRRGVPQNGGWQAGRPGADGAVPPNRRDWNYRRSDGQPGMITPQAGQQLRDAPARGQWRGQGNIGPMRTAPQSVPQSAPPSAPPVRAGGGGRMRRGG